MQFCKKIALNADCLNFLKTTPASVMKPFKANGASLISDFHRASLSGNGLATSMPIYK